MLWTHGKRLATALLLSLITLFAFTTAYAQNGKGHIKGRITTPSGDPAAFVTIVLKGSKKAIFTGEDGWYNILNVPVGNYEVVVSLVGYRTATQNVVVENGKTSTASTQLELSNQELQEVVVNGNNNRFAKKESFTIGRLPIKNMENPQVYSIVDQRLIKDQVITDVAEAMRNAPGALIQKAGGGSSGAIIRGFSTFANVRNGLNTGSIGPADPINIERIEIIKGPSATLFGSLKPSYGGVLNYVTKKPTEQFKAEVGYTGGSWELSRIAADVNAPVNDEKTILARVTASFQSENSFQDRGYARSYSFAPSIVYKVSDRLTFSFEYERVAQNWGAQPLYWQMQARATAKSFDEVSLNYNRNLLGNGVYNENTINSVFAHADYKISNSWTSSTNFASSEGYYGRFTYWTYIWMTNDSLIRQPNMFTPDKFGNVQLQQNFIGTFNIAGLKNRMVVGLDYSRDYSRLNRTPYGVYNYDTINVTGTVPSIDNRALDAWAARLPWTATKSIRNVYAAYVSDVLNITDQLMVMLSLRVDKNETQGSYNANTGKTSGAYDQTTFSPKLGIVYQPVKDVVSVFGNYMNGFQNLPPAIQTAGGLPEALKPQRANQLEGGVKLDLFGGKVSGTFSYYDIKVENSTFVVAGVTKQEGEQTSKGFEAELLASPVDGLSIVGGYAYNENKFTKGAVAQIGKYAAWAPKNMANLWISYRLPAGNAKGFGVGVGGNYIEDSWFDAANTFKLPGYTLVNAAVFYDKPKFSLNLKLNNLLNEHYWNTNTVPQKPFNVAAGVTLKF
ncbi:TonB-dependent receptor [uncultured Chitinophaga sp.]|uniref:TonB-dependent receptor n=1 Tax=uncultured Chitinophaga sp. TaxID=339340 RepID=UPI0025D0F43F|nr:TonB-dependent receptor [uncultured Chitinophaga sp.]